MKTTEITSARWETLHNQNGSVTGARLRRLAGLAAAFDGGGVTQTRTAFRVWWLVPALLALLWGTCPAPALTVLSSNQLVFVNVDHAPMGACSSMAYGYKGDICGVGTSTATYPYWIPTSSAGGGGGGVLIALSNSAGIKLLPFLASAASVSSTAQYFPDASIQRSLTPCTDEHTVTGAGLTFTHLNPAWSMPNIETATPAEKRRCLLPATWMIFTVTNANPASVDFYFGLPVAVTPRTFAGGAYQGVAQGEAALAVPRGSCELLSGAALTSVFNAMTQGFAFHLVVPAGQTRELAVVIAYYRGAVVDSRTGCSYYYTTLYPSIDSVVDAAFAGLGDARMRCQQLATAMSRAGLNPYRQFLASHSLHSYMSDTACLVDPQGRVHWWEMEGIFNYINTFDLTVDHAFFACDMHPWALRNVLDAFSGALPGTGYSYETPLYSSSSGAQVSSHGYSFYHDMGFWPTSATRPAYGACMGLEELQAWILSAGLYWSHTGDHAWLTNNLAVLQSCLNSMLLRDHTNAAARDGIPKNVNSGEITTYDSLDGSLVRSAFSGRMAVRNWACYLALDAMFGQAGAVTEAVTCQNMAAVAAQTIVNRWNAYRGTLGYLPALLDGSITAATFPMIEGLVYPAAMGLTNAVDRAGGPYAPMLQALSNHVVAVLVPGKCLDASCGAIRMTSSSSTAWQSKVFICQYVAEAILGITNNAVNGTVDQIHASVQIQDAPFAGFSDALDATGGIHPADGVTYPRGVTSALWWLTDTNNPAYPAPAAPPVAPTVVSALAGDGQVWLCWQGVPIAIGYNLRRATVSGGPYVPVTNGLAGASFVDTALSNGTTYYYVLAATNAVGESAFSAEVSATPVPGAGGRLSAALATSQVTVFWPSNYVGWILQTNAAGLSHPSGWGDIPESITRSQMTFPAGALPLPKYFRLRHP